MRWLIVVVLLLASCRDAAPQCGPATCKTGCCDLAGACVPGTTVNACGTNGNTCSACTGNQACTMRVCQAQSSAGGGAGGGSGGGVGGGVGTPCEAAQAAFVSTCGNDATKVRRQCDTFDQGSCRVPLRALLNCVFMNASGLSCDATNFISSTGCSNEHAVLESCAGAGGGTGGGTASGGGAGEDDAGTDGGSASFEFSNGTSMTIAGTQGQSAYYALNLTSASELTITISGGVGDVDLYLRQGLTPSTSDWDARAESTAQTDSLVVSSPAPGTWYLLAYAYGDYRDVQLTVTWQ